MHKIIDLHCDTVTALDKNNNLYEHPMFHPDCHMDYNKVPSDTKWAQCHAIFMPDDYRGQDAIDFYEKMLARYNEEIACFTSKVNRAYNSNSIENAWQTSDYVSILTVEGGSCIAGNLSRIKTLAEDGVQIMTLVWNGKNEIASGHNTDEGFSEFGKEVIPEMEKYGIIVDASHLNDKGFYDLLKIVKKPFMATHSNARSICSHKRNLTDEMIKEMINRDCLIGLNYYKAFLSDEDENTCDYADMFYQHIMHFLQLGAAKNLALGSDFDGAYLPDCLSSPAKVVEMYDYLLDRGIEKEILDDIYYKNALRFLREN